MTAVAQVQTQPGRSTDLLSRLRALASPRDYEAQLTPAAVLVRIDETILPRAFTLTGSGGSSLRLLVSNRRLMRVETACETSAGDDAPADPEAAAQQFAQSLKPMFQSAGPLFLKSARYPSDAFFWNVGCSAGRLAKALDIMADPIADQAPQDSFETLLDVHAIACASVDGDGKPAMLKAADQRAGGVVDKLVAQIAGQMETPKTVTGSTGGCTFLQLSAEGRDGVDAMIASGRSETVVALVPSDMRDRLMSAWHKSGADTSRI